LPIVLLPYIFLNSLQRHLYKELRNTGTFHSGPGTKYLPDEITKVIFV